MIPSFDATWAGVLAGVVGLVVALFSRRWRKEDSAEEAERRRAAEIRKAAREWRMKLRSGDREGAMRAMARYNSLRAGGPVLMAAALALLLPAGCRTAKPKPTAPVPPVLSEHVQYVKAGYVVPELPEAQTDWLLLTVPKGVELMLPLDFPEDEQEPR